MQGCTPPPYFEMDCYATLKFEDYINNVSQMWVQNQNPIKAIKLSNSTILTIILHTCFVVITILLSQTFCSIGISVSSTMIQFILIGVFLNILIIQCKCQNDTGKFKPVSTINYAALSECDDIPCGQCSSSMKACCIEKSCGTISLYILCLLQ